MHACLLSTSHSRERKKITLDRTGKCRRNWYFISYVLDQNSLQSDLSRLAPFLRHARGGLRLTERKLSCSAF